MICTEKDEYVQKFIEGNPSWEVILNDGLHVFQDDNRPNITPINAWVRLHNYVVNNDLYITNMIIRFRSNIITLPENLDGYYFCHGVRGMFGNNKTIRLFFVGYYDCDTLIVQCWKVPEMLLEKTEIRDKNEAGARLILK